MILSDIGEDHLKALEEFVLNHPQGNFFQSPQLYNFYKSLPGYKPELFISVNDTGEINGSLLAVVQREKGFLKGLLSRRCIVIGGPLIKDNNDNNKEIADKLLHELINKVKKRSIYIEFRNLFNTSDFKEIFRKNEFDYLEHLNYFIKIVDPEENFDKLSENRKRQIKKSIKLGTRIIEANNINEIKEFYEILRKLYKKKVKKPLPGLIFFKKFFLSKTLGKYFFIKKDGKIIGGIMCPVFKETIYEWYLCGLDSVYKELAPSVMATWAPIEYAAKNGIKYFDFMGAGSPGSDYGVREFKSRFGGELVEYGRFLRVNNKFMYFVGKLGIKIIKLI